MQVIEFRDQQTTPHVVEWEKTRTFPANAIAAASELGLLGMEISPELGGLGMTFAQKLKVLDVLSEV